MFSQFLAVGIRPVFPFSWQVLNFSVISLADTLRFHESEIPCRGKKEMAFTSGRVILESANCRKGNVDTCKSHQYPFSHQTHQIEFEAFHRHLLLRLMKVLSFQPTATLWTASLMKL